MQTREIEAKVMNGWAMCVALLLTAGGLAYGWLHAQYQPLNPWHLAGLIPGTFLWMFLMGSMSRK